MTRQKLQELDYVCHLCNGYHCSIAKTNKYHDCVRWKVLDLMSSLNEQILDFHGYTIYRLVDYLVMKVTNKDYVLTEEQSKLIKDLYDEVYDND